MRSFIHSLFSLCKKNWIYKYILTYIYSGQFLKPLYFIIKKTKNAYLGYPYCLLVEPTNACNIKCPLCPSPPWLNSRPRGFLSFDNFLKLIDNSKDIIYRLNMTQGGEPFLNKEICKMIKYANRFNLYKLIFTNATLLDKQLSSEIIDSGLEHIVISFDGFSKDTYESFRQGANFEKTVENIKTLGYIKVKYRSIKPFIEIQWILTKYNESEVNRAKKEISNWQGINTFTIKSLCLNEHFLDKEEVDRLKLEYLPSYNFRKHYIVSENNRPDCPMPYLPVVLWDGSLSICCYDFKGNYIVGNIFKEKLEKICRSSIYHTLLKQMYRKQLPLCKRCPASCA